MPTATFDLIDSNVLGSNSTSITFSSVPSTYRDLVIVITAKQTAGTGQNELRFNGDSGSNYGNISMEGTGSITQSGASATTSKWYINLNNGDLYSQYTTCIVQIMDYAQAKHKSGISRGNGQGTGNSVGASGHIWRNTNAITSITISASGTYSSGSTFYLYGIAA